VAPTCGPVVPSGFTAPGGGYRGGQLGCPGAERRDPVIEEGDLDQQQPSELAVVVIEHAVQGLCQIVVLGPHPAAGRQPTRGVALADDHRLDHVLRRDGGQRGPQQLFQPLPATGPLVDQPGSGPGAVAQVPDRLGRHERGAQ